MSNKCKSKFSFQRENSQRANSTIDIGVYFGSSLIFTIEAKVLPTPKGTKKAPRFEYEYVYGKGAGIQRFKEGRHGLSNEDDFITENGLIAYIKQNDFHYWLSKINGWILEANWEKLEKLEVNYFDSTAKLTSEHKRVNGAKFKLHHFWVNV